MAKGWGQICRKFQFEVSVEAKEKKLPIKKKNTNREKEKFTVDWPSRMMCCQSRDSNTLLFFLFGQRPSCL